MKILESEGCCIDAVSPGEVYTAKKLGFEGERILFTGNNITDDEKIDVAAKRIMNRFKPAFEELAK